MENTLTKYEKMSLLSGINLSDGHARQNGTPSQIALLKNLSGLAKELTDFTQFQWENKFRSAFFDLGGQKLMANPSYFYRSLICYSSSNACEIVGNFLRIKKMRTLLLSPTFDNLARILIRHEVRLTAVGEDILKDSELLQSFEFDALFLVLPNNPTGASVDQEQFTEIVAFCKKHDKLLIIDFAFRFFSNLVSWDQYQIMESYDIDYITMEDTGKTWSIFDQKVGVLVCSKRLHRAFDEIHDDYLLNVSNLTLQLLVNFIDDSRVNGIAYSIREIVDQNRMFLRSAIRPFTIECVSTLEINVEWLKLDEKYSVSLLHERLVYRGIHILPGNNFFWEDPTQGMAYIRLPLARNVDEFKTGINILCEELIKL